MKNLILPIVGTLLLTAVLGIATSVPLAKADPAGVFNGFTCGLGGGIITHDSHSVDTQSENSNTNLNCQGDVDPTSSGRAEVDRDFACGAGGLTFDSHSVTTPDGHKIISCHNNNK